MFSGGNPSKGAMKYLDQIPGAINPYYKPYIDTGKRALPQLEDEYGNLINDPGGMLNRMGGGFQQSPGFQFALDQALRGSGHAAAAGGMAGSPQHEQQNMQLATQLGNQDYYNWLNQARGLYGAGLQGMGQLGGWGLQAGNSMADQIAQALAAKSQLSYAGQAAENQSRGSMFDNFLGAAGALSAFL